MRHKWWKRKLYAILLIEALLVTWIEISMTRAAQYEKPVIPGLSGAASMADDDEPHYILVRPWLGKEVPAGYRIVAGGYEYFVLEKLPAGAKKVEYKYVGQGNVPESQFLDQLNAEGTTGYRYFSNVTIGVPVVLERQEGSPGYEYRFIEEKAEKLNAAAAGGFVFVGPLYRIWHGAYVAKELIVERPLKQKQSGEGLGRKGSIEYALAKAYRISTMLRNVEALTKAGYCAVHAEQNPYSIVFQKTSTTSMACAYESLGGQKPAPKRKCPWYLSCPPDYEAQRANYGDNLEQGLNELGARGFHFVGTRLHGLARPLLERSDIELRRYEYRVIQISGGGSEPAALDRTFREGFRVVTLDGNGSATYYAVMERSDETVR